MSINKEFLPHMKIFLQSLVKNYPQHPDIVVYQTNLSKNDMKTLQNFAPILFLKNTLSKNEVGSIMGHLPKNTDPRVFYARFLIWKNPLFKTYDKIVHLDADIIVTKPFPELFEKNNFYIELEAYTGSDKVFYEENGDVFSLLHNDGIGKINEVGNAGVFMVTKKHLNKETYGELMYLLKNYGKHIKRADQSVINIWIKKKGIKISHNNIYNFQHRALMRTKKNKDVLNAKIIHFNAVPDPYRIIFMKLFLKIGRTCLGVVLYKTIYTIVLGILNIYNKVTGKSIYKIY